jgi:hypothetical protein
MGSILEVPVQAIRVRRVSEYVLEYLHSCLITRWGTGGRHCHFSAFFLLYELFLSKISLMIINFIKSYIQKGSRVLSFSLTCISNEENYFNYKTVIKFLRAKNHRNGGRFFGE